MSKKLDDTRKRLDIDDLDPTKRKDLFNKFVDKGGKVVSESDGIFSNKSLATKTKTKTSEKINTLEAVNERKTDREPEIIRNTQTRYSRKKPKLSFVVSFNLWFNAYSNGVINFTGRNVNASFIKFIKLFVIPALLEIDTSIFNMLNPISNYTDETVSKRKAIIATFKETDDLELLERVKYIYDESLYEKITRAYRDNSFVPECRYYINEIKVMVKPIFIINLYRDRLKLLLNDALNTYGKINNISKSITTLTQTRLFRNIDLIYDKFYPRLLHLLMYISKVDLDSNDKISSFLEISEKDILGFYTAEKERNIILKNEKMKQQEKETVEEVVEETEEDKKKKKIVAVGIKLIDKLIEDYQNNNNKVLDDESLKDLDHDDKIYQMGLLLNILDNEYTDLFSSNKVKYNILYADNVRIDYHGKFSDIILNVTDMNIKLKEYSNIVWEIKKIESDKEMRIEQRAPILNDKRLQMRYLAKNIKNICANIVAPLKNNLDALLLSKEERERIISNPHDIIKATNDLVGVKKRTEGYTVIQALTEVYYFVSGFNYLITEGKLSGIGLLVDDKNES